MAKIPLFPETQLGHLRAMKRKAASGQVAKEPIELKASLPSGRSVKVAVPQSGTVADLKQPFLRLAAPDGRILDPTDCRCGLQDGDSFTAIAQQQKTAATEYSFALWCAGGRRAVTWGARRFGGDRSRVRGQLRNVKQICGTERAFAATLADGTVVTGVIKTGVVTAPESEVSSGM